MCSLSSRMVRATAAWTASPTSTALPDSPCLPPPPESACYSPTAAEQHLRPGFDGGGTPGGPGFIKTSVAEAHAAQLFVTGG